MKIKRILSFFNNRELLYYYFKIRIAKKITSQLNKTIDLTTSDMAKKGIKRICSNGKIFFSYKGGVYEESVATGNAISHIEDLALTFCYGLGLDIGCKSWPLKGSIGIDNNPELNAYNLEKFKDNSLDYVFSSHCLEHLDKWQDAIELWIKKIKKGGIIFLYLPHPSMTLWEPGSPWVENDHVWSPSLEVLKKEFEKNGVTPIKFIEGPDSYYSFFIVGRK